MRRLDELLTAASDRGNRTGPDVLIEHLERRLAGEREQVVAAPPRRHMMVTTETRPTTPTEHPPRRRTRLAIAVAGFVAVAAAVVVAIVLAGGGDDVAAPETPADIMDRLIAAIESVESQIESPIFPNQDDLAAGEGFLAWNIGLGTDPEFSNCEEQSVFEGRSSGFACDVTMGEDYFFSVVAGENLATWVTATVQMDGSLVMNVWRDPTGLVDDAVEFREWIRATHPELEERMFGNDYAGVLKFTGEAGELHTQYLEEYLEYLGRS